MRNPFTTDKASKIQGTGAKNPGEIFVTSTESVHAKSDEDEYRRHGFKLGNTGLLLPKDMTSEVADDLPLSVIPNSPAWLKGMVNLRGNIVPIIDLTILLNMNSTPESNSKQYFFKIDNEWVGIYINGLPRLLNLPPDTKLDSFPAMPWKLRPFVKDCYRYENNWLDIDLKAIFR